VSLWTVKGSVLAAMLCLYSQAAYSQVSGGHSSAGEAVVLRLLLPESTVCLGSKTVDAEIELRNVSDHAVTLMPGGIGSGTHFESYPRVDDPYNPNVRFLGIRGEPWPRARARRVVTLSPGESFRTTGAIDLEKDFFSDPWIYKVRIDFSGSFTLHPRGEHRKLFEGNLKSNWVYFEVADCGPSEVKPPTP